MTSQPQSVQFTLEWSGVESLPVMATNQMLCQVGAPAGPDQLPDGLYLTFGFLSPPVLLGDEDAIRAKLDSLGGLATVRAQARFAMSKERAQELIGVLTATIQQINEAEERGREARA